MLHGEVIKGEIYFKQISPLINPQYISSTKKKILNLYHYINKKWRLWLQYFIRFDSN